MRDKKGRVESFMDTFMVIIFIVCLLSVFGMWVSNVVHDYRENTKPNTEVISVTPEPTDSLEAIPTQIPSNHLPLPKGSSGTFKAYMGQDVITRESSDQWHLKQLYWIDALGFCRFGEYYVIAIGQYYSNHIGDMFQITLPDRTFKVIVGDVKQWKDTVDGQYCKVNGSIIEFIVDKQTMDKTALKNGDLTVLGFYGKIVSIEKIG